MNRRAIRPSRPRQICFSSHADARCRSEGYQTQRCKDRLHKQRTDSSLRPRAAPCGLPEVTPGWDRGLVRVRRAPVRFDDEIARLILQEAM